MTTSAQCSWERSETQATLRLRVLLSEKTFCALEPDWNRLLQQSEADSIFLSWEWARSHSRAHGTRNYFVVVAEDVKNELAGLAPFCITRWPKDVPGALRVLRFIGDGTGDSGEMGVISQRGDEDAFASALMQFLLENHREWDALDLNHLGKNACNSALLSAIDEQGCVVREREVSHLILPLPHSWEDFLATLSQKRRASLRAAARKLQGRQVEYHRCLSVAEVEAGLQDLFRLHNARWKAVGKSGAFHNKSRRDFYCKVALGMRTSEKLDLWTMSLDGVTVAAEFGLVHSGTRSALQSGFDPQFRERSVGLLLEAKVIQSAIESGLHSYDFLEGEHDFKKRWGAQRRDYKFVRCAPAGGLGAAWVKVSGVKAAQKFWAALRKRNVQPVMAEAQN